MCLEQLQRDRAAHRVPDHVCACDVQVIEETRDVVHHLDAVGTGLVRFAAAAVAAAVHRNDPVAARQRGVHGIPHREIR